MQVGNLKGCGLLIGIHMASSTKTAHITVVVYPKAVGRTNFKKIVELCYVEIIRIMKKKLCVCVCVCVCAHMYLCIHNFILYRVLRNWHLH